MVAQKDALVAALKDLGHFTALTRGGAFRAQAYLRAAKNIEITDPRVLAEGRVRDVPGIGEGIAARVEEFMRSGHIRRLDAYQKELGGAAGEIAALTGLSPEKLRALNETIGLDSRAALLQAAKDGRVREVKGFGPKREAKLIEQLGAQSEERGAFLHRHEVEAILEDLDARLRAHSVTMLPTGAWRRAEELVDRVEIVVDAKARAKTRRALAGALALEEDADGFTAKLGDGVVVRCHVSENPVLTQVLQTADAEHLRALETLGLPRKRVTSEAQVYAALGLPLTPPELRRGEPLEHVPALVEKADVRGALHCHTSESDGANTLEEMVRAAEALGFEYITITDHSPTAHYAHGVELDRLYRAWDAIDALQEKTRIRLLKGCESDILKDGALDYPPRVLDRFDVIIASIHTRYKLDRKHMTERVLAAIRHPLFKIWGHPFGRLVASRPPIDIDMERVLEAAQESRVAFELNGDPYRLDLPPEWAVEAKKHGIRFVISSDAHSIRGLNAYRHSVAMARRAGLTKRDILNTLPAAAFVRAVKPPRCLHSE